jgi:hypothetical protein
MFRQCLVVCLAISLPHLAIAGESKLNQDKPIQRDKTGVDARCVLGKGPGCENPNCRIETREEVVEAPYQSFSVQSEDSWYGSTRLRACKDATDDALNFQSPDEFCREKISSQSVFNIRGKIRICKCEYVRRADRVDIDSSYLCHIDSLIYCTSQTRIFKEVEVCR